MPPKRSTITYSEPGPDEVRRAGYALVETGNGYTRREPSCHTCAAVLGVPWTADFFEGQCRGCEAILSGFPIKG